MQTTQQKTDSLDLFGITLAFIGFLVCWLAFYPGFMSADSLTQYAMANSFSFRDQHPPLMSLLWSALGFFFEGPSGLLFFHLFLLWSSLYIFRNTYKKNPMSWTIYLIGFLPWIINFSGVLWKDVGMAFSFLAIFGIVISRISKIKIVVCFTLLFYAINIRYNSIFAALPITMLLIYRMYPKLSGFKTFVVSISIIGTIVVGGNLLNYTILNSKKTNPSSYIMTDDLLYLSVKNKHSYIPRVSLEELQDCAVHEYGGNKLVGKPFCLNQKLSYKYAKSNFSEFKENWFREITNNPISYLRFRLAAFSYLIRSPSEKPYYIWHRGINKNQQGIVHESNGMTILLEKGVRFTANHLPFMFKPYWWLELSLILLIFTSLLESSLFKRYIQALLASSILYVLGYFPLTPMGDFRYIYWSVVATTLSLVLLFIVRPKFKSFSMKKGLTVSIASLFIAIFLYNFDKMFSLNIDEPLYKTIIDEPLYKTKNEIRIPMETSPKTNDFLIEEERYYAVGNDPFLRFDIDSKQLKSEELRFFYFEFFCYGMKSKPKLQFFWWGDGQTGPTGNQSFVRSLQDGINLVPLKTIKGFSSINNITGIRLDLVNSDSCKATKFSKLFFLKSFLSPSTLAPKVL